MRFNYQTKTKEGEIRIGTIEASSHEAALNLLQKQGFFITLLEEIKDQPFYLKRIKFFEKVTTKEIVLFTRQLSILFKSNVPLRDSLNILVIQTKNQLFQEKIVKIIEDVESGAYLSQAMARHPSLFSIFYVNMIKSSETVGKLSESLSHLADHLEREYEFNSQIKGAMIYPIVVSTVVMAVILLMMFFIIPRFATLLIEAGEELPWSTAAIIALSNFLKAGGWVLFIFLFGLGFLYKQYIKTEEGKKFSDNALLKIPILKDFLKKIYLSRFAATLSTLISGGLPIIQSLEAAGAVVGNIVYKNIISQTQDRVKRGEKISFTFDKYPEFFPPLFVQMVVIGERTGRLEDALTNVKDFYQKEVERGLETMIRLIEPIMIIFLGLIVAGLVGSILAPLYGIGVM